jgi:AcrR family transcriptional regulator
MADVKGPKPTRREKAALTRARMLDAAYDLFCELGFRATTMDAIATRAGVAVQTLYFTFHTKDDLVQAVHERTVLGDDQLPPPLQPWYQAAVEQPDITKAVAGIVRGVGTILARVAPMVPAFHAVAGDPAGEVWRRGEELRLQGMAEIIDELSPKSRVRRGLSREHAADLLFVLLGPALYRSLVFERGWSAGQWATWVERSILRDVFDIEATSRRRR